MIEPAGTSWPSPALTPRRWPTLSRPFLELEPAFLWAIASLVLVVGFGVGRGSPRIVGNGYAGWRIGYGLGWRLVRRGGRRLGIGSGRALVRLRNGLLRRRGRGLRRARALRRRRLGIGLLLCHGETR